MKLRKVTGSGSHARQPNLKPKQQEQSRHTQKLSGLAKKKYINIPNSGTVRLATSESKKVSLVVSTLREDGWLTSLKPFMLAWELKLNPSGKSCPTAKPDRIKGSESLMTKMIYMLLLYAFIEEVHTFVTNADYRL